MTTHLLPMPGEDLDTLRSIAQSMYLDGECYAFAIAVSRGTRLPIVGLMEGSVPRHALVYWKDKNKFVDVRGLHGIHEPALGQPFGHRPGSYDLQEIPEAKLYAQRQIDDSSIAYAQKYADILLPMLPWKQGRALRAKAFCDELEDLCRRHGFWIRSPVPAAKPILCEGHGDEDGYSIKPTSDGGQFTIDRRLKGESLQ